MARHYEMSYRGAPHFDWRKLYKGQWYRVRATDLPGVMVSTKEGSGKQANEWWRKKKSEIDGAARSRVQGAEALADRLLAVNQELARIDTQQEIVNRVPDQELALHLVGRVESPHRTVPADRTVGHLVTLWLDTERSRVRAGKLGKNRLANNQIVINHVRDWLGADTPVECLNEQKWLACHAWLSRQVEAGVWSVAHADRIFGVAKRFVRFCWELRLIDLPRNLDSRSLTFTVPAQEIEIFTVDEVRRLYAETTGQSKLHLLLMLNWFSRRRHRRSPAR